MTDRLDAALQLALRTAPYLRDVIAAAKFVVTPDMPKTAACDKYWRVYFHPEILERWSPGESAWVILHECAGHLLRRHYVAATEYPDVSAKKLNIAQDLEIESWEWPDGPAIRPSGEFSGLHPSNFGLQAGLTWRHYLDLLPDDVDSNMDCGSGAHGQARPWEFGEADAPIQPGSTMERAVVSAAAAAILKAKEVGKVPAGLEIWAEEELKPPTINWRSVLRSALTARLSAGMVDMIGPSRERRGLLMPRWRAPRPRIAIVADTSGSMNDEGGTVLGACVDLCRVFGQIDVCWCDVNPVWQSVRSKADLKPVGGGGTDISAAIQEARKKNYDAIVVITDCETPWPKSCRNSIVLALNGGIPPKDWRKINVN